MKKTMIALLIAVLVVAIGAGLCFAGLSTVGFKFRNLDRTEYRKHTYTLAEPFDRIDIKGYTADVDIVAAQGDTREVVVFESEREKYTVSVEDGCLAIRPVDEGKSRWFLFGFHFKGPRITLTVPQGAYELLQVELDTGDLAVSDLAVETVLVNLDTGRAEISGLQTTSIAAHSDTGDLRLSDMTPAQVELSVDTGKIELVNLICSGDIRCESSTGDIRLTDVDGANLYLSASTGDITGTVRTQKVFSAESSTGKVSVPDTAAGGSCEAETSTGDIRLSISGE